MKVGTMESFLRHCDTNTDIIVRTRSGKRTAIDGVGMQTPREKALNIVRIIVADVPDAADGEG